VPANISIGSTLFLFLFIYTNLKDLDFLVFILV
jgi:hypothetical protein